MLKKINEFFDNIIIMLKKIKQIYKIIKKRFCMYISIATFFLCCLIYGNDLYFKKKVNNIINFGIHKKQLETIQNEISELIDLSSYKCLRKKSFLLEMIEYGDLTLSPQDGIMNCEFEALLHYISNNKPEKLKEMKFLHILIDRKASTPFRDIHSKEINKNDFKTLEHKNRIRIRSEMLFGKKNNENESILSNNLLKYKIFDYYVEKEHEGLENAKKYEILYSGKFNLYNVNDLNFDNIIAGAYFFIKYKGYVVIFYGLNGYQYDVQKPSNALVIYRYNILNEESFKKTHYFTFLDSRGIEL